MHSDVSNSHQGTGCFDLVCDILEDQDQIHPIHSLTPKPPTVVQVLLSDHKSKKISLMSPQFQGKRRNIFGYHCLISLGSFQSYMGAHQ